MEQFNGIIQLRVELVTRSITVFLDSLSTDKVVQSNKCLFEVISMNPYFLNLIGRNKVTVDVLAGCLVDGKSQEASNLSVEKLAMVNCICETVKAST
jgi:hypothetical protein